MKLVTYFQATNEDEAIRKLFVESNFGEKIIEYLKEHGMDYDPEENGFFEFRIRIPLLMPGKELEPEQTPEPKPEPLYRILDINDVAGGDEYWNNETWKTTSGSYTITSSHMPHRRQCEYISAGSYRLVSDNEPPSEDDWGYDGSRTKWLARQYVPDEKPAIYKRLVPA
jgi:hypothetical protein